MGVKSLTKYYMLLPLPSKAKAQRWHTGGKKLGGTIKIFSPELLSQRAQTLPCTKASCKVTNTRRNNRFTTGILLLLLSQESLGQVQILFAWWATQLPVCLLCTDANSNPSTRQGSCCKEPQQYIPLAKSLAQSWHSEKSWDHCASHPLPGVVDPQLLQRTHLVHIWKRNVFGKSYFCYPEQKYPYALVPRIQFTVFLT